MSGTRTAIEATAAAAPRHSSRLTVINSNSHRARATPGTWSASLSITLTLHLVVDAVVKISFTRCSACASWAASPNLLGANSSALSPRAVVCSPVGAGSFRPFKTFPRKDWRVPTPMRPFSRSSHSDVHFLKGSALALNLNLIADMW
ncbi:hypothetical protein HFN49_13455 [Rhizobium leguminosarum]|nr:hypothetical protein [Rhizobium leguminosarum]QSZ04598.1 hypothetical protein J3P73_28815 [Rhizobium ruizarguesonis]